jgi:hypothetical protein
MSGPWQGPADESNPQAARDKVRRAGTKSRESNFFVGRK